MSQPDEQDALSNSADGAQPVPAPHAPELRQAASPPLKSLDGCRVMVQLSVDGLERSIPGQAEYGSDPELGNVLRIYISRDPEVSFVIAESLFSGRICALQQDDCDYVIWVGADSLQPPASSKRAKSM